jgi:hypothetical protein
MLSPSICFSVGLRWAWWLDWEQRKVRNGPWILLEELRPVHCDLYEIFDLRLARKAIEGRRQRLLYVLSGSFRDFGDDVGERDIRAQTVGCLAGVV